MLGSGAGPFAARVVGSWPWLRTSGGVDCIAIEIGEPPCGVVCIVSFPGVVCLVLGGVTGADELRLEVVVFSSGAISVAVGAN